MITESQGGNESDCLCIGREMNTQSNCQLHYWHYLEEKSNKTLKQLIILRMVIE